MKAIYRITESDLHNLVQRSVLRILREQDNNLLLQSIAQSVVQQGTLDVNVGENDGDFELQGDTFAHISFEVLCDPYMQQDMRTSSYDEPSDSLIDKPTVEIGSIEYCREGYCTPIRDNGIVKKALEKMIRVDYSNLDIPTEQEYYDEY